jgi:hypothetical protein
VLPLGVICLFWGEITRGIRLSQNGEIWNSVSEKSEISVRKWKKGLETSVSLMNVLYGEIRNCSCQWITSLLFERAGDKLGKVGIMNTLSGHYTIFKRKSRWDVRIYPQLLDAGITSPPCLFWKKMYIIIFMFLKSTYRKIGFPPFGVQLCSFNTFINFCFHPNNQVTEGIIPLQSLLPSPHLFPLTTAIHHYSFVFSRMAWIESYSM